MSTRVVYIIPGFHDLPSKQIYVPVREAFIRQGITPIPITVTWHKTIISECVAVFLSEVSRVKADETYLFGFSFGALIAFIASTKMVVTAQILCSLSPYFTEDLPVKKSWGNHVGKKRLQDFEQLSSKELVKKVTAKTIILYGAYEREELIKRDKEVYQSLSCQKKLIEVNYAKHDIANVSYLKEIQKVIADL